MPSHVTLANFTDQGARTIKDSPERFEAFKSVAEGLGITIKNVLWTTGAYDLVLVSEGPEEAMMTAAMKVSALGNVRTQTLRGFTAAEVRKLTKSLA